MRNTELAIVKSYCKYRIVPNIGRRFFPVKTCKNTDSAYYRGLAFRMSLRAAPLLGMKRACEEEAQKHTHV